MPQLHYHKQDLQNRSFKQQNLADVNFSKSDIRGCNFSDAMLAGADFQQVKTGQSRKQLILQFVEIFVLVVGFAVFLATNGIAAFAVALFAVAAVVLFAVAGVFAVVVAGTGTGVVLFAIAVVVAGALAIAAISAFCRGAIAEGIAGGSVAILFAGFAIYWFREQIKTIRYRRGTIFEAADLTNARFSDATIHNADFSNATLDFVDWTHVSFARCKFPNDFNDTIRALCTSRNGCSQDYSQVNLQRLHLAGVELEGANLLRANLNDANLQNANLKHAHLESTQALGTDFSHAVLTGACIQHWGINAATRFNDVRCDYIYLEPNQQERRPASGIFQPGDFAKLVRQFSDTLVSNTLDFLFHNGIEPQAFDVALRNLLTEYEDAGLSLHSLVDVGDGNRFVKLAVANPEADKAPMHAQFTHDYELHKQLAASREAEQAAQQKLAHAEGQLTVYREQSVFLQGFVYHQTDQFSRPILNAPNAQFTGDPMSDKRSNIELNNVTGGINSLVGGDNSGVAGKEITGAAGGDISGTLTLTLGQLEATKDPDALKLADLLKQLKTAIETPDAGLDAKDKEKALKHVDAIAKLGGDRKNPDLLERAGDALDALPTIVKRGNGLLEFSEKYLPTITAGIKTVLAAWGIAL
ncbi:MAG: pentapeptide repeat-containing protein [Stenomitos rutilans HA7619-LM2]|jgi:uncharacterized protein YjbI with pentapeptide repeats|nr:pentapeptide repeat-containing protein [Stenomitos rutilans HA7619-LM2]